MDREMPKFFLFLFILWVISFSPLKTRGFRGGVKGNARSTSTGSAGGVQPSTGGLGVMGLAGMAANLSGQEGISGALNGTLGAILLKQGMAMVSSSNPAIVQRGREKIVLGGLHLVQAKQLFSSSDKNHAVRNSVVPGNPTKWPWEEERKEVQQGIETLKSKGYKIGASGTVVTPNGETYHPQDINAQLKKDPSTLNALQKAQQQALKAAKAKAQKYMAIHNKSKGQSLSKSNGTNGKFSETKMATAEDAYGNGGSSNGSGGGGILSGGGGGYSQGNWEQEGLHANYEGRFPSSGSGSYRKNSKNLKGLSKVVNGTSIGIQDDNIFELAHRRYLDQDYQNQFMR